MSVGCRKCGEVRQYFRGAGNCLDDSKYQKVIKEACMKGSDALKIGATALDACELSIVKLENSGNTNCGFGSNLTFNEKIECDASIMDSTSLGFGACTNVSTIKNPIQLARCICDGQSKMLSLGRIPPMIMAGAGAETYAKQMGLTMVEPSMLVSSKARRSYMYYKSKCKKVENINPNILQSYDTVGAVCIDIHGNISAGCSSGGVILKLSGRIGQAACYGAGCWAQTKGNRVVGTCTTGNGEYLIKSLLAREIATNLLTCSCPATSLHDTYKQKFLDSDLLPRGKQLYGGAISIMFSREDQDGELLWSHTTQSLCLGYMSTKQKSPKFINSSMPTYSKPGEAVTIGGHHFKL